MNRENKVIFIGVLMSLCCAGLCSAEPVLSAEQIRETVLENRPEPLRDLSVKTVLTVAEFGAVPNDGKDDCDAVWKALAAAKASEAPVQVVFGPGVYDFAGDASVGDGEETAGILLAGVENLIVDGQGADVMIHRRDFSFSKISNSRNVIIRNFTVDYDPLPFSQGTVLEIDRDAATFIFELHDGFAKPTDPFFKTCDSWGMLKDAEHPGRLKAGCPSFFKYESISAVESNRFRIVLAGKMAISSFQSGDVFVINGRAASIGEFYSSKNVTFDHITSYACPGSVFIGSQTAQLNVLNCRSLLKGNRLLSSGADGIHCQSARIGPWIENCEFQGLSDDCLNIYGLPVYILSQESSKELKVYAQSLLQTGDRLAFFSPGSGRVIQETRIVSVEGQRVMLSDPVEKLNIAPPGSKIDAWGWKGYDHAYNLDMIGNHFIYRNNYLHDGRRYGAFIKASYGLIENNRFEGLSRTGINIANEPGWPEGFWARNLLIAGNEVVDCGYGYGDPALRIAGEKLGGHVPGPFHENILLLNNRFHSKATPVCFLSGIRTLTAEKNIFSNGSESGPLIHVQYSEDVFLTGNEGQHRVERINMDTGELVLEDSQSDFQE